MLYMTTSLLLTCALLILWFFFCIYMFILSSLALYVLILNIDIYRTHHSINHRVEIFDF